MQELNDMMKFAIVLVATLVQVFGQSGPFMTTSFNQQSLPSQYQSFQTPAFTTQAPQVQGFTTQAPQVQGFTTFGPISQTSASFPSANFQAKPNSGFNQGSVSQNAASFPSANFQANTNAQKGPVQISNDALLALAAQNGLDVDAIRQQLNAGLPVQIDVSTLNAQQQTPKQPANKPTSMNTPRAIMENLNELMRTAADPRTQQVIMSQDFQQWHAKLLQDRPEVVGMRHSNQPRQ